jgi:phage protein D/phage baseplate assembly protein gpV
MPGYTIDLADPDVQLNGSPLPITVANLLERVVVDDHLRLPAMFELTLRDPHDAQLSSGVLGEIGVQLGDSVTVSVRYAEGTEQLLTGEVTSLEADIDASGSHVLIRGYDKSHRLHRGRKARSWAEQKDSEIASAIAQEAGLTASADDSGATHAYIAQPGVSDWEFLLSRAREIGFDLRVSNGSLEFKKPASASDGPEPGSLEREPAAGQIVYGDNLVSFRPRVSMVDQASSFEAHGWDVKGKRAVVGTASASNTSASIGLEQSAATGALGEKTYVRNDRLFSAEDAATTAAEGLAASVGSSFAEAEGVVIGDPMLRAGSTVSVSGVGSPFDGKYVLTSTRHVLDRYGYRTHFVVSGRQDRTLIGLVSQGAEGPPSGVGQLVHGAVPAVVTEVKDDPDNLSRVKVKFPWLDDSFSSDWARVVFPGAGKDRGFVCLPEIDDEVLVCFEQGDFRRPYVLGGLLNGVALPKDAGSLVDAADGTIGVRAFTTRVGHSLKFTDADNGKGIKLSTGGEQVESLELDAAGHTITISSSGNITIKSGDSGTIGIKAGTSMTLEATSSLELKAPTVKINSDGQIQIKSSGQLALQGTQATLKGDAMASVESGGILQVQGSLVKIN